MDRVTLLRVKSTIFHCPPSIITRQRTSVDSKMLCEPRNVVYYHISERKCSNSTWLICLARSANLPEGLYILLALISSFFLYFFTISKAISVSTVPIFTIFSPNVRYLREFSWSGPVFPIPQGMLPSQPILCRTGLVRLELKNPRIHWTDFHNLCTIW